jgi:hypothetical protein
MASCIHIAAMEVSCKSEQADHVLFTNQGVGEEELSRQSRLLPRSLTATTTSLWHVLRCRSRTASTQLCQVYAHRYRARDTLQVVNLQQCSCIEHTSYTTNCTSYPQLTRIYTNKHIGMLHTAERQSCQSMWLNPPVWSKPAPHPCQGHGHTPWPAALPWSHVGAVEGE